MRPLRLGMERQRVWHGRTRTTGGFASVGPQTIRFQQREDGISIDQIVLSPNVYLTNAPGATKQDALILPVTASDHDADAASVQRDRHQRGDGDSGSQGPGRLIADTTAAYGVAMGNPDAGLAKVTTALAATCELRRVHLPGGRGQSLSPWGRGKADKDSWANDSVQSSSAALSMRRGGRGANRIDERLRHQPRGRRQRRGGGLGLAGQRLRRGRALGLVVKFQTSGPRRCACRPGRTASTSTRFVLSSVKYLTVAPGPLKNDSTIAR